MKARKITKLRGVIGSPGYLKDKLKRLERKFKKNVLYWSIGKNVDVSLKNMERTSRMMDRVSRLLDESDPQ